jgi:hypothetical protein
MGYVNVTDISQFIPPSAIQKTAGTWTPTISSNVISDVRSAHDSSFTLLIPLSLPGSDVALQGAKIKSVDVWYKIATNAADDFATVALSKVTLAATSVAVAGAAVTVTVDTAHDTAAERLAIADHKMTVTLATAAFIDQDYAYWLSCVIDAHANTVFTLFGARVNYTLRL